MVFLISLSLINAAAELASEPLPNVVGTAIKEAFFLILNLVYHHQNYLNHNLVAHILTKLI